MPSKTIVDFAYQVRDYMRSAEVVPGKNIAYSQENNAVIASIENGKSYKVRWTGSATITLKKDSASGTEVTSGSTSPLSFTADSDFDLYFGSSADVTEIMVYDGASTDDTYEPYYVPVKDRDIVQTITISGLSNTVAKKMGKIVSIVFNNENVGTLLGKTLPTELLPAGDVHCLGIVRADTTLVHNLALFDYLTDGNMYLYYTPTYGANRVPANTSSTNLLFTGTITYISKY